MHKNSLDSDSNEQYNKLVGRKEDDFSILDLLLMTEIEMSPVSNTLT